MYRSRAGLIRLIDILIDIIRPQAHGWRFRTS